MNQEIGIFTPPTDLLVELHHKDALDAVARMSPTRKRGAEIDVKSWRRLLTAIDPDGTNGYAFAGHSLKVGASAQLPVASLLLAVDTSWAKASWYAGQFITPGERCALLQRVTPEGLEFVAESRSRTWARDILGHLMRNQALMDEAGVTTGKLRATSGYTSGR